MVQFEGAVNSEGGDDVAHRVRSQLEANVGMERVELWVGPETTWHFEDDRLTLCFATDFASDTCQRRMRSEIAQALREVVGHDQCEISFTLQPQTNLTVVQSTCNESSDFNDNQSSTLVDGRGEVTSRDSSEVDLCASIVRGESNQVAIASVKLALTLPGQWTPVVLHGPAGCGKSLMLSAIAQKLRLDPRSRRVVSMTSEQFTNDFTESLRGGGLPMFRRKYRDVDALLLDDLQFFVGKRSTVAEVRYTIDYLIQRGKQIVVTMDRPLNELGGLGDELLGRLRGGMVAPMLPLDSRIRLSLLQRLAASANLNLQPNVLERMADRIAGDGRLIRGVVHRLAAVASLESASLTWDRCWSAVYDLIQCSRPVVRLADIERVICGMFGLDQDSLQSESKMRSVSQPRMLAMFLARKYTPAAYKEIGDYFGRRRHSTVISAEKTVESWLKDNARLDSIQQLTVRDAIRQVEAQLKVG